MEVHHHSHHPKSWKEYVQEFLMLFFAVFLGFMAEYYLEYRAERHKEHDYLVSMKDDLKADLSEMQSKDLAMEAIRSAEAKLAQVIYKPNWNTEDIKQIYLLSNSLVTKLIIVNFSSGTIDQLQNAGGYRLIRNDKIVGKISDYEKGMGTIDVQQDAFMQRLGQVHQMQNKILYLKVFPDLDQKGSVIYDRALLSEIISSTGSGFLTTDKNTFFEYANYVNVMKGYVAYYEVMSKAQQQKAKELIKLIEEELEH
ncbi:MAG: hypothetical protein ACKOUQ_10145 [Aquirufa sp.]